MSFLKSFATVSGWTMVSRALGYVRETLIATYIGAGPYSDAFFLALRFPNIFRRLFGEGALNVVFVPMFSHTYHHKGHAEAFSFAQNSFSLLFFVLIFLTLAGELCIPFLMHIIAPGFDPAKMELVTELTRITFPYIFFIALSVFMSGILTTRHQFAQVTAAHVTFNLSCIGALLFFSSTPLLATESLAWSIVVSGVLHFIWIWVVCAKSGFLLKITRPQVTPESKQFLKRLGPGLLGGGMYQINLIVADAVASYIPSAISYLTFATRISLFPVSLIGVTLGTVLLPTLSKHFSKGDIEKGVNLQNKAIEAALFLTGPCLVGIFLLAAPIIDFTFHHGLFTDEAAIGTTLVLQGLILGLPAHILINILTTNFFARGDTRTPVIITCYALAGDIILSIIFAYFWSYVGIALASSCIAWGETAVILFLLRQKNFFHLDSFLKIKIMKIIAASFLMGLAIWMFRNLMHHSFPASTFFALGGAIGVGMISYAMLSYFLNIFNLAEIKNIFGKKG